MKRSGFTMLEILIVSGIMLLVMIPAFRTFSYSNKSFEKNVSRNETLQQGQIILNYLQRDLAAISLKMTSNSFKINIFDLLRYENVGPLKIYTFYSFIGTAKVDGKFENILNKVSYVYDENKKTLQRIIKYNGANSSKGTVTNTLGTNVNHFELQTVVGNSYNTKKTFIRPFFALIEKEKSNPKNPTPAIREFMCTITPELFNSMLEFKGYNRNFNADPQ